MKTADEMFRELGYKKKKNKTYHHDLNFAIVADTDGYGYFTKSWNGKTVSFSNGEILACAQLIREMEESKNE